MEDIVLPQGIPGHLSGPHGETAALSRQQTLQALQPDGHGFASLLQTPATEQQASVIQHKGASVAVTSLDSKSLLHTGNQHSSVFKIDHLNL